MTDHGLKTLSAGLLGLAATVAIAHGLLVTMTYDSLPATIPAFVTPTGQTLVAMAKSPLAAARLPLMGGVAQAACWTMACLPLDEADTRAMNRLLWAGVSLLVAVKMLAESLQLVAPHLAGVLRFAVVAVSALGLLVLWPSGRGLWARFGRSPAGYGGAIGRGTKTALAALGLAYLALVLMPWWRPH